MGNNIRIGGKLFLIMLVILTGCSSVPQEKAEITAKNFVMQRVKFYATENQTTMNLPNYDIKVSESHKEGSNWAVAVRVSSFVGNETKEKILTVKINSKGEVFEFEGNKLNTG